MKSLVCILVGAFGAMQIAAEEAEPTPWGVLLPAVSIASDYRFNGMSLSNREPALQASLHLWRPDGFYAGVWLSSVDFQDGVTSVEYDSYAGRNFNHGKVESKVEVMYLAFNDARVPGPTYDFWQFKVGTSRRFDALSLGMMALWSPSGAAGAGAVRHARGEGEYRLGNRVKATAALGRRWVERGFVRTYWDAGLIFEWRKLDFEVRYVDTNLSKPRCFYTDWCDGGLVTKLTLASY